MTSGSQTAFKKPFLSLADEGGSIDDLKAPSPKTCLVIEKESCRVYTRGKSKVFQS